MHAETPANCIVCWDYLLSLLDINNKLFTKYMFLDRWPVGVTVALLAIIVLIIVSHRFVYFRNI